MATLNVIRRWALRDQLSIREISRRTGLARNTVKKYLRSDETEPRYERRGSSSKLDPYAEKLATWLGIEATKSRKQRRTLRQIHTDSTQKGENQELIHIVSTFCSQRVWVKIRWKTRGCGYKLGLVYAVSPRRSRYSTGLRAPSEILIRFSLYQRMYESST